MLVDLHYIGILGSMKRERINMKNFEIEVEKVEGYCSCDYSPGDKFYAEG